MGDTSVHLTNNTDKDIVVFTFNQADLVFSAYYKVYEIKVGHTTDVHALGFDFINVAVGLRVDPNGDWHCRRWNVNKHANAHILVDEHGQLAAQHVRHGAHSLTINIKSDQNSAIFEGLDIALKVGEAGVEFFA